MLPKLFLQFYDDLGYHFLISMRNLEIIYMPHDCALFPFDDLVGDTPVVRVNIKTP